MAQRASCTGACLRAIPCALPPTADRSTPFLPGSLFTRTAFLVFHFQSDIYRTNKCSCLSGRRHSRRVVDPIGAEISRRKNGVLFPQRAGAGRVDGWNDGMDFSCPRRGFCEALWAMLVDVCSGGGGGEVVPGVALTLPRACCLREDPDRSCELLGRFPGHLLVPGCRNLLQAWKD